MQTIINPATVHIDLTAALAKLEGVPEEATRAWLENEHPTTPAEVFDALDAIRAHYYGTWTSTAAFAANLADDLGFTPDDDTNPNPLLSYVDFDAWWDAELRQEFAAVELRSGAVAIFRL